MGWMEWLSQVIGSLRAPSVLIKKSINSRSCLPLIVSYSNIIAHSISEITITIFVSAPFPLNLSHFKYDLSPNRLQGILTYHIQTEPLQLSLLRMCCDHGYITRYTQYFESANLAKNQCKNPHESLSRCMKCPKNQFLQVN